MESEVNLYSSLFFFTLFFMTYSLYSSESNRSSGSSSPTLITFSHEESCVSSPLQQDFSTQAYPWEIISETEYKREPIPFEKWNHALWTLEQYTRNGMDIVDSAVDLHEQTVILEEENKKLRKELAYLQAIHTTSAVNTTKMLCATIKILQQEITNLRSDLCKITALTYAQLQQDLYTFLIKFGKQTRQNITTKLRQNALKSRLDQRHLESDITTAMQSFKVPPHLSPDVMDESFVVLTAPPLTREDHRANQLLALPPWAILKRSFFPTEAT